jgi:hypothetical protein
MGSREKTHLEAVYEKIRTRNNFRRISAIGENYTTENLRLYRNRFVSRMHEYSGTLGRN